MKLTMLYVNTVIVDEQQCYKSPLLKPKIIYTWSKFILRGNVVTIYINELNAWFDKDIFIPLDIHLN